MFRKIIRVFNIVCAVLIGIYIAALAAPVRPITAPVRPAPPSQNGFLMLKAATDKPVDKDAVWDAAANTPKKQWTLDAKRRLIAENSIAIEKARAALGVPYYEENNVVSLRTKLPYYSNFHHMGRVFVLAGNVAWSDGKQHEAIDYYLDSVTMGRRIPHRAVFIGRLTGIACEALGRSRIWQHLDQMDADNTTYTLARLEALDREKLPLWLTVQEEKYSTLRASQEALEYPRSVNFISNEELDRSSMLLVVQSIYSHIMPHRYVLDTMSNHMDKVIAQSKRPYITDHQEPPLPNELLAQQAILVVEKGRCKYVSNEAADALLRTTLALRVYRLRNGKDPNQLSDLVAAKILKQVPEDPFALPGTPLQYKAQSTGTYLVYSIGPDGVDNKGMGTTAGNPNDTTDRAVVVESKGDMVAGWYPY